MNLKKILPLFSYLFHPIFIPVYAALFYFFVSNSYFSDSEKYLALLQIVIITMALPVLFYFVLRSIGQVNSIMIEEISQRKLPLTILCFLMLLLLRKSITLERFQELHFFFLGGLISVMIALVLLFFKTKVSLHMIGISSLTIFITGLSIHNQTHNINWIALLVFINGVVATSRLEMKAHTFKELTIGLFSGIIPQLLLLKIWL